MQSCHDTIRILTVTIRFFPFAQSFVFQEHRKSLLVGWSFFPKK